MEYKEGEHGGYILCSWIKIEQWDIKTEQWDFSKLF
jgi:hypothetical protein